VEWSETPQPVEAPLAGATMSISVAKA
jgi:hypothetical protein